MDKEKRILDVMLDLETTGITDRAGILEWAMVPFDRFHEEEEDGVEPFHMHVDLTSCFMAGMDLTSSQDWWVAQEPQAKALHISQNWTKISIGNVTAKAWDYLSFLAESHELVMWSRGMDFDFPKIEWCFRRFLGKEPPYRYYNKRDARTIIKESGIDESQFRFEGIRHSAMDDCMHQIKVVKRVLASTTCAMKPAVIG